MARIPSPALPGTQRILPLEAGWRLARTPAGACADPAGLPRDEAAWREAPVPGTVAAALGEDAAACDCDADDWWYQVRFAGPERAPGARWYLRFDGLATLAEAWLNGRPILASRNMFAAHRVDVTGLLAGENTLAIRFASLTAAMAPKRARPRWRTALVARQELRWFRTTLLGRIPGWAPAPAPVGPWGPVALEPVERLALDGLRLHARLEAGEPRLDISATVHVLGDGTLEAARVRVDGEARALALAPGQPARVQGALAFPGVAPWWPHTHGTPHLARCQLELRVAGEWHAVDCGAVGFRTVALDEADGRVRFLVNGVPVFCRGACWTPPDVRTLRAAPAVLREELERARDAGLNMLRVGGTMVYESDAFYALCDRLGILVWQDFMFANMDYPFGDAAFREEADAEVRQQLARLHRHPCIAAYCGGSEIAQQAAMLGLAPEQWSDPFFREALPAHCAREHPGVPYFPATPWGGALPFHVGTGISHYYGVGAYRRPLADVKSARVRFAAECLGFANVPDAETIERAFGTATPAPHHPRWKAGEPRDTGAGWDFEDIRDHYLRELFGVDPFALRSRDLARYYALSRVASAEAMRRVFAEWRAPASGCGGALVWFYRDLVPGAGWGIVDATGRPKAAYWYLKRAWSPRGIHLTDEGLDGLAIHVVNDAPEPLAAVVELEMLEAGERAVDAARRPIEVPARSTITLQADALLGYFSDCTSAYRFGPPRHDVIAARLATPDGQTIAEDWYFPLGMDLPVRQGATIEARARWRGDGRVETWLRSGVFLQAVALVAPGFAPDDNHFHLAPGRARRIVFTPRDPAARRFRAHLEALNLARPVALRAEREHEPMEKAAE